MKTIESDVALIGVGLGGFAALRALLESGLRVAATEEYAWIGGQATSQALCVLDEYHDPAGEGVGYSRRYAEFRESLRRHYRENFRLSTLAEAQLYFNPGNAMNSHMVAEPAVAQGVMMEFLRPYLESGQLTLLAGWVAESAVCRNYKLESILCRPADGSPERVRLEADFFLDGTEAGDTYPLLPVTHRLGADGPVFDERHAEPEADVTAIQSSTVCFAVEYVPGGDFRIPRPSDYEAWWKSHGPFHLDAPGASAADPSLMFVRKERPDGRLLPPAFYYRSVIDRRNFDDPRRSFSRTIFNTGCNDYHSEPMVGPGVDTRAVYERAKALSRAYLYWLQNEAPRDEGGFGYPELRPCPEITGTPDGFAMAPYIREGRRLAAYRTIVEEDIAIHSQTGARAAFFSDSVGLGGFVIDIHRRTGKVSRFHGGVHSRPYQIPLAALVTPELENFACAGKCIGTTQITNGAYRLHNIEWAIGEAAGELAAFCLERKITQPCLTGMPLFAYQQQLVRAGVPVFWYEDIGWDHPAFEAIQLLSVTGIWPASRQHLRFDPHHSVARAVKVVKAAFDRLRRLGCPLDELQEIVLISHGTRKADAALRLLRGLEDAGWPENLWRERGKVGAQASESIEDEIPQPLA